ncbi:BNR-4 repeat-containing protein [bacterium AH-315-E10]|nr:BNR-4 repeat-containing protein [bacterium AH-315-E10]
MKLEKKRISEIGSERATSGGGNKIVTYEGKTHIVWQDVTEDGYLNQIRTLNHKSGKWSDTFMLNKGLNNHARPVLSIDQNGYLHAIMSGHNSPVSYRRSQSPNDSSSWTHAEMIGKGTYPFIACGPDGSLYVVMRSNKRWNGVDFYIKRPGKSWKIQSKLVERHKSLKGYGAFQAGLVSGKDGVLHCVIDFYEGEGIMDRRGLHQAVCYLRSRDKGLTWEKADGSSITLPARPEGLDILARSIKKKRQEPMPPPVILAQGCIVVDTKGIPHILYISHLDEAGKIIHAWTDSKGKWQQMPIDAAQKMFPKYRPAACRGSLTINKSGTLYALLELLPLGKGWENHKPTRKIKFKAEKKLLILLSSEDGKSWRAGQVLPTGDVFNQASFERPTGVNNPKGQPSFIYFDGESRYPEKGEIIQNNVYFVLPDTDSR